MKILITGGLGYLGGRVADHIHRTQPEAELCLTTRNAGKDHPSWTHGLSVIEMDVRDKDSIEACLRGKGFDAVIHLAAASDSVSLKDPGLALEVNTAGAYQLLESASANGIKRFVYYSTIHVYGPVLNGVITEESPTRPVHPYAITHRAAEDLVNYFRHYRGMETVIFRTSNGYGYPMHKDVDTWQLIFNGLCRQLMTEGRITLRSSGKQRRDFITLGDAAEAARYFLFSIPGKWGDGLYNLGSGGSISVLEAAGRIEKIYREKYGKTPGPLRSAADPQDAPPSPVVDYRTDKIRRTGYEPKGNMDFEIEKTLKVCEQFSAGSAA